MSNNITINHPRGHPREFEAIITEKSRNFVGREFVFSAINNYMNRISYYSKRKSINLMLMTKLVNLDIMILINK